jgi:DNA-binding IclR family transcriptional regulator
MSGTAERARSGRPPLGEPLLGRAFRLLGAFLEPGETLPLHLLAERAGLPKSTTSRLAGQLLEVGALERLDGGEFVIGVRLLEIASLAPRGHGLRATVLPYMEDLHRVTGQHVLLAVREADTAVLVERLSARDATLVKYRVGGRLPLASTGIGIVLLAHAPDEVRERVLLTAEDAPNVRRLMAMVRAEGVCVATGPNPVGTGPAAMSTVAAAILDPRGTAVAALSLVAPADGFAQAAARSAVLTTSMAISRAWPTSRDRSPAATDTARARDGRQGRGPRRRSGRSTTDTDG